MIARKLPALLCGTLVLTACASRTESGRPLAQASSLIGSTLGLDHVLVWSKDPAAAEATLANQLGFACGPAGSYGAGIANNGAHAPRRFEVTVRAARG
jgi:hypothetical protein